MIYETFSRKSVNVFWKNVELHRNKEENVRFLHFGRLAVDSEMDLRDKDCDTEIVAPLFLPEKGRNT